MNSAIKNILTGLRGGNLQIAYEYKAYLNDVALLIYNKPQLDTSDIEDLKDIITICNITYNDTDKELLPIEDGVYDLLLEKYKTYDPNFQVGAEIIDFEASKSSSIFVEKKMQNAVYFDEPIDDKDVFFFNDIVVNSGAFIDHRDDENLASPVSESYINKRKHDTGHNHPELVGTLDKCKFVIDKDAAERGVLDDSNVKTVERDFFQNHLLRGVIQPNQKFDMVLELKYDGVSVEADCTDEVVSARSRGDTGVGAASDLTPILKGYKFPHRTPGAPMVGVKFEAIMTEHDLPYFNKAKNYNYANCRSAIVGLLASSDAWKYRDFITLVPLAVEEKVYKETCHSDRMEEIEFMNHEFVSKGCPMRYTMVSGNYIENLVWIKIFAANAELLRNKVPFMYDGIVVSYRDQAIRNALGRENFINKYSIAVKFNPLKKETVFRGYTYTIGQDGSVTPMIHYDPVEFYGTIHDKSSGHSYKRFIELALHNGDVIDVEYVNDVMPYVSKPTNDWNLDNEKVSPLQLFPTYCPICGSPIEISTSGKSAKCINPNCGGRQLARMVNTCAKLGMDGFGEATIQQIGAYKIKDLFEILTSPNNMLILKDKGFGPGESSNLIAQANTILSKEMSDAQLLGSIGFTGISTKTWELILEVLEYNKLREAFNMLDPDGYWYNKIIETMSSIKGIGPATADTIGREFKFFQPDVDWIIDHGNVKRFIRKNGRKVIFSGFRDKEFETFLNENGFYCDQNASLTLDAYALIVPDYAQVSSKTKKAKKYGIQIVTKEDFLANMNKYK